MSASSWHYQPSTHHRRIQSQDHIPSDHKLEGRHEKRLPIAVVVCLTGIKPSFRAGEEKTYTENVSLHGARAISRRPWQPGDEAQVTIAPSPSTIAQTQQEEPIEFDFSDWPGPPDENGLKGPACYVRAVLAGRLPDPRSKAAQQKVGIVETNIPAGRPNR